MFYVAVEVDQEATSCIRSNVTQFLHFEDVTQLSFDHPAEHISKADFQGILVAGGSPCQGNSRLNKNARGLRHERTLLFRHIQRIADKARIWLQKGDRGCPVYALLESLAHAPAEFTAEASASFKCRPLQIEAFDFG